MHWGRTPRTVRRGLHEDISIDIAICWCIGWSSKWRDKYVFYNDNI